MTDDVLENNRKAAHIIQDCQLVAGDLQELMERLVATQGRLTDDLAELVGVVKVLVAKVDEINTLSSGPRNPMSAIFAALYNRKSTLNQEIAKGENDDCH